MPEPTAAASAPAPAAIRLYFDFISPYAYLAWRRLPGLAAAHGRAVEPRPVLLAGILGAIGTLGPAESPGRRAWTYKHVARVAHDAGEPIRLPPAHPFNPLPALRAATAAADAGERARVIDALYRATWATGDGVDGPDVVAAALRAAGLDADRLLAAAESPEVKARLRATTDELLAAGGFGVPTMLVDGELFFGFDSFPHLDRWLRGADPLPPGFAEAARSLPASAVRKR